MTEVAVSKESTLGALSPSPTQGEDTAVAAAAHRKKKIAKNGLRVKLYLVSQRIKNELCM